MKQASFLIDNSLNKDKKNVSEPTNLKKELNKNIDKLSDNKNTIIYNTKTLNKPRKLVENIYYF